MLRKANAVWQGSGKEGKGVLSTQSGVLAQTQYSFNTRFEDGIGTNPEELIGAAHAGCFAMKLSFNLTAAGFVPGILGRVGVLRERLSTIDRRSRLREDAALRGAIGVGGGVPVAVGDRERLVANLVVGRRAA